MKNFKRDSGFDQRREFNHRGPKRQDFGGRGGDRQLYQATCGECGKDCEVPFEPRDGRPVLCSDCFSKKDDRPRREGGFREFNDRPARFDREDRRPRFDRSERQDTYQPQSFTKPAPAQVPVQNNEQLEK